ncbi:RNA polymerase subunit sigma-54 [Aerococcaceae bacterium DSM 109653]|uniref:RNA polymerase subunit sigma-54 n=2 Tax=Fundicoccus ignavus TaxID=2664442 RepID=A0A844BKL4_9LACT|nr:RNA polymerase subunit sigma-54 [Fundicoccus ignavus]MRJ47811.1 RNA polymerase subunit sigma-54 [Fundicoccus ignavus]
MLYNRRAKVLFENLTNVNRKEARRMTKEPINQPSSSEVEHDEVKVFQGLTQAAIMNNLQLLDILDLNAEQLTYYLEEAILENPFIDLDYALEKGVANIQYHEKETTIQGVDPQLPRMPQNLSTFLFEQIMLYRQTEIRDAMVKIVDYLDDRGYLPYTYSELASKIEVTPIVALDAMTLIKQLEPAGVGARDLQESLMLQTEQDNHAPNVAYLLLEEHFDALSEKDYAEIVDKTQLSYDEVMECVNYFHTLRPSPATLFDQQDKINLIPDVTIVKTQDKLGVRYNRQYYPKINFNQSYFDEMKAKKDAELLAYIQPHHVNYLKLAENLRLREQLVLEVTKAIVLSQSDYFMHKSSEYEPLLIKDIAKAVRLSEPVVNLIVTNKNVEFEKYVCPLTDFINVSSKRGRGGLTASNIKQLIFDLLEKHSHELSDEEVVELLKEQKVMMSSQLVHTYRQSFQ